jgi:carboxyl-terminal processing protease
MVLFNKLSIFLFLLASTLLLDAKQPQLTPANTSIKLNEIMKQHASFQSLNKEIVKRALTNYLEELDPNKTYFIESDIKQWIEPSDAYLDQLLIDYKNSNFSVFEQIHDKMTQAIMRHRSLEKQIHIADLPKNVNPKEFKDMKWAQTDQELLVRLERIRALQIEASTKLNDEVKDKALQRIAKHQLKYEEGILNDKLEERQPRILANVLKATASALDSHTTYFTPEEAQQFMISVQQRLFGIGVQLRDDLNGFTVVKVIEGGPAALGKELKAKDRIIAVNGEPVVGMDIIDAVELIRGEKNTPAKLTIIRDKKEGDKTIEEKLDVTVVRDEVVFKEMRYEAAYEPYGDGVIAYLRLYSFYQDPDSSSATDLEKEFNKIMKEHSIKGVVLDLRYNSGGLLTQAVDVSGLFMTKGIVVSIKDNTGAIQHLRELDEKMLWDGPLIVLVNRGSASAAEIVAQTLQDYGRALVVGDDHTFGKGSFQTFTLNTTKDAAINPEGEYKVTRGRYYTVSGKTPQLTGVLSDIIVPGGLSESEIGEEYAKHPLANDQIKENYDDDLSDVPFTQRAKIRLLYKFDLQPKETTLVPFIPILKKNSAYRIEKNKNYQNYLKEVKKAESDEGTMEDEEKEKFGENDLQLTEAFNIMKDLLVLESKAATVRPKE